MTKFKLTTNLTPKGSQPYAIKRLVQGIENKYIKHSWESREVGKHFPWLK